MPELVHHATALGEGLYHLVVGEVEDVGDRLRAVLGAFLHDAVRDVPVMRIFPVKSPVFSVNTLSYRSTVKMVFSSAMMLFVFNAPW